MDTVRKLHLKLNQRFNRVMAPVAGICHSIFQSYALTHSHIKCLEAAGFGATERFPLTGFLRQSSRIYHLLTWHLWQHISWPDLICGADTRRWFYTFLRISISNETQVEKHVFISSWNCHTPEMIYNSTLKLPCIDRMHHSEWFL